VRPADSAADRADLSRRDAPDRPGDLRDRLDRLPPGHPSSPYETDGTRRDPFPRLREPAADNESEAAEPADRVPPLDDAEWHEHVAEVRSGLAGKSTVLSSHAGIDRSRYLTINPDDIKEQMGRRGLIPHVEGLSPMEASELVHEESSFIAKRLALRATADQKNVIWDITMSRQDSTEDRIDNLHAAGYSVTGIFVDIPVETSVRRAEFRHRSGHEEYRAGIGLGGRYVPPEVIRAQADDDWGSKNRKTFEAIRHRFDQWSCYDNSVDGRPPVLAGASQPDENREERA
jgi:predicted ABC-type ATPase